LEGEKKRKKIKKIKKTTITNFKKEKILIRRR
jgi:hypothetical protein